MKKFLLIIFAALLMTGCGENSQATPTEIKETIPMKNSFTVQVNGKNFLITPEDNLTARAFAEMLPLEVEMNELNGNEKFCYLEKNLPGNPVRVKQIHAGDLMLFGSDCLVIFYKDFVTSYSYTRLGRIDNPDDLEKIFGTGNVRVSFLKN